MEGRSSGTAVDGSAEGVSVAMALLHGESRLAKLLKGAHSVTFVVERNATASKATPASTAAARVEAHTLP